MWCSGKKQSVLALVLWGMLSVCPNLFSETTCCVCQYQNNSPIEGAFIRMGCAVWILEQEGCVWSDAVPFLMRDDAMTLPKRCEGGELKVGYVGHWSGSFQTVNVLQWQTIPTAKKYNVSIRYENTGCDVLDNAEYVQSYLSQYKDLDIELTGSQVETVGLGDKMLMPQTKVGTRLDRPQYPACDRIAESSCMSFLNRSEKMKCDDHGTSRTLSCCPKTVTRSVRDSGHIIPTEIKFKDWFWTESCDPA